MSCTPKCGTLSMELLRTVAEAETGLGDAPNRRCNERNFAFNTRRQFASRAELSKQTQQLLCPATVMFATCLPPKPRCGTFVEQAVSNYRTFWTTSSAATDYGLYVSGRTESAPAA